MLSLMFFETHMTSFLLSNTKAVIYSKIQAALFHSMKVNNDHQERFSRHETLSNFSLLLTQNKHIFSVFLLW